MKQNKMENKIDCQDAIDASIVFANALRLMLQDNQGVIVDIPEDCKMYELQKKVVVFKFAEKVHIYKCEDDIPQGTAVMLNTSTDEANSSTEI